MSKYSTGQISGKCMAIVSKNLEDAFPALEKGFFRILWERVEEHEFSDKRLLDAIKHVIDTCKYPSPSIESIIQYDKPVRLYTYDQMLQMLEYDKLIFEKCKILKTENRDFYVKK